MFFTQKSRKSILFSRFCFISLLFAISYIAFLPNYNTLPELTSMSDVLNHFLAFLVLSFFLDRGFSLRVRYAFAVLFAYGFYIEGVQYFLPNRAFELLDIAVDMIGFSAYYLGRTLWQSRRKKKSASAPSKE